MGLPTGVNGREGWTPESGEEGGSPGFCRPAVRLWANCLISQFLIFFSVNLGQKPLATFFPKSLQESNRAGQGMELALIQTRNVEAILIISFPSSPNLGHHQSCHFYLKNLSAPFPFLHLQLPGASPFYFSPRRLQRLPGQPLPNSFSTQQLERSCKNINQIMAWPA